MEMFSVFYKQNVHQTDSDSGPAQDLVILVTPPLASLLTGAT